MKLIDRNVIVLGAILGMLLAVSPISAQSTDQNYPTPVTSTEITGTIKARDVGDARLTSYFYQFDGSQGDLFINIVTRNLTGDIDVFTMNGLRPLSKIVVYGDLTESETGRVIYLRKPEKMILRIHGRTPGDEPATFRIKFAGSFVASTMAAPATESGLPSLTAKNESGIRVNSVGTIVEIIPKATPIPAPVPTPAEAVTGVVDERSDPVDPESEKETEKEKQAAKDKQAAVETKSDDRPEDPVTDEPAKKVEVVVTDNLPPKTETVTETEAPKTEPTTARDRRRTPPKETAAETEIEKPATTDPGPATLIPPRTRRGRETTPKTVEPDPLANVNLVIAFKDGKLIERRLSDILRFTVDKGILTVIAKDGSIGRYSMLDVAKVTIE